MPGTDIAELLDRTSRDNYSEWLAHTAMARGCSHPVRLRGEITDIDSSTGEVIRSVITDGMPDGVIYAPCGTRRASICPSCAETYRRDAYQLIKAGLDGGKGVPADVATHPAIFATFTAPSFGPVHSRVTGPGGKILRCRPRRKHATCPHGRSLSCPRRHKEDESCLGRPLCPDCYDYNAAVVWNAHAPELWRRTIIGFDRLLSRLSRQHGIRLSRSYAKVAEFQARGVIHFHAVIRLDTTSAGSQAAPTLPAALTTDDLARLLRNAVTATWFATVSHPANPAGWTIAWGGQLDIRPIQLRAGADITSGHVAGYLAKYATKSTEPAGLPAIRITSANISHYAAAPTHQGRLIRACWKLGAHTHPDFQALRRWTHMLGYRGHFLTKSRRYSVTFKTLRAARANWHRRRQLEASRSNHDTSTVRVTLLTYAGTGWHTTADAFLAISAAARAREHERIAREEISVS